MRKKALVGTERIILITAAIITLVLASVISGYSEEIDTSYAIKSEGVKCYKHTYGTEARSKYYVGAYGIARPPEKYYGTPNARPLCIKKAQVNAMEPLREVVKGIHIDSNRKIGDVMAKNKEINDAVTGIIRNFGQERVDYTGDGECKVLVVVRLEKLLRVFFKDYREEGNCVSED